MKLYKISTLLVTVGLVAALAACGSDDKKADNGGSTTGLDGQTVTIAVENAYPPFNYVNKDTNVAEGWDYTVWREICKRANCMWNGKSA